MAIADSVGRPPESFTGEVRELVDCRPDDATPQEPAEGAHGWDVARIVERALPEAEYDFHHSLNEPGENSDEFDVDDLIPPIDAAVRNSVDVLNMSAGVDSKYGAHRSYERVVRRAAESGTTVVAAAGNENKVDRLAYPARAPAAICVAGCISRCRRRRIDEHLRDRRLWVHEPSFRDGPYCSARGCHRRTDCTSQEHRWWHGNVEPMGYKPDVSASAVHFTGHETPPIREGTSFSTPLITGALGRLVGETDGRVPTGEALAQLIRRNSKFLGADLAPQADHNRQQFAMSEIRNALDET